MNLNASDAVAAMSELIAAGYTNDFRIRKGRIVNTTTGREVGASGITVEARFRFVTDPAEEDASNVYALTLADGTRGFLVDQFDLEADGLIPGIGGASGESKVEPAGQPDLRYGVRKVGKAAFNADPDRYVLRLDFPDFPPCPFGQGFTMLGFDTAAQEYVWLASKIIRDERLKRIPYAGPDSEA